MKLLDLCDDPLLRIMGFLPVRDKCRTFSVCKKLNGMPFKDGYTLTRIRFHKKSHEAKKWFNGVLTAMEAYEDRYAAECHIDLELDLVNGPDGYAEKELDALFDAYAALDISTPPLFDSFLELTDCIENVEHEERFIDKFMLGVFGSAAYDTFVNLMRER